MKYLSVLLLLLSSQSYGWVETGGMTINKLIQSEGAVGAGSYALVRFEGGVDCHVAVDDSSLYSLILSSYVSGKAVLATCYDAEENIGGYTSHKLHRLIGTN